MVRAEANKVNLALGRSYLLDPGPNYALCTDPGDLTQLTDGSLVKGSFWTQQGTVGWNGCDHVDITIDLGSVQPIGGVDFHTAAGAAGVKLPRMIFLLVSDDGRNFRPVSDIAAHPPERGPGDAPHPVWYRGENLQACGRYIRLLVFPGLDSQYVFCDEIQVWRGDDALLRMKQNGPTFQDNETLITALGVARRLRLDLRDLEVRIAALGNSNRAVALLAAETKRLAALLEAEPFPVQAPEFKTILPYGDAHRAIFRLNADLLAAQGVHGLVAWTKHRYAPMGLFDRPGRPAKNLQVRMLDGERRAEVINLTNASREDQAVQLQIQGLPDGINPDYVNVRLVEWWDTRDGTPVLAPLVPARLEGTWFEFEIPAGMTRQVWLSFRPTALEARTFSGRVVLQTPGSRHSIDLKLTIDPASLPPRSDLDLWMWDYTAGKGALAITPGNRQLAIDDMRAHGVDIPCALDEVLPKVGPGDFDSAGNLVHPPDFTAFDRWVGEWPGARRYHVLFPAGPGFFQFKTGTPELVRALGQFASAWADHNHRLGLQPKQVILQLVDEPADDARYALFATWANALQSATAEFAFFINPPGGATGWSAKAGRAYTLADIICPLLSAYLRDGAPAREFYGRFQAGGKSLRIYNMFRSGSHDPTGCERLVPWLCFARGFEGAGFWSYADAPRSGIWNDYIRQLAAYSPVLIEPDALTSTKHWEALQEGMEDYACLCLLRDRATAVLASHPGDSRALAARVFLQNIESLVIDRYLGTGTQIGSDAAQWDQERDTSLPDEVRLELLDRLASLASERE